MPIALNHRGNYKDLLTYKKGNIIYDITFYFCHKYLSKGDRTIDQMIQAARSGKQNIAEGVAASVTNAETEIRLVNVGKASFKELLCDYEDYLRTRGLRFWEKDGKEIEWMRRFAKANEEDSAPYLKICESRNDEVVANIAIMLLKQEDYLLFKQLKAIQVQYDHGENMHARVQEETRIARKQIRQEMRNKAMKEAMAEKDDIRRFKKVMQVKQLYGY